MTCHHIIIYLNNKDDQSIKTKVPTNAWNF